MATRSDFGTSSAEWDLFLKEYGGFALASFLENTVMADKVRSRSIRGAKSATFPKIGTATAQYHVPGENLLEDSSYEMSPVTGEIVINVDRVYISTILIADIDEALSYHDVRQPYARNQAHALSKSLDVDLMRCVSQGTQTSATSGWTHGDGYSAVDADFESGSASDALTTIRAIATTFDKNSVPQSGRHLVLGPNAFHKIRTDSTVASTDYNTNTGGDVGLGTWLQYAGFKIHMTPIMEDTSTFKKDHSSGTTGQNNDDYKSDNQNVVALAFQEDCIGHVRAMDLSVEGEYHQLYQGTVMTARIACGSAVLNHSGCGRVKTA